LLQRHAAKGGSRIRLEVIAGRKRHQLRPSIDKHVTVGATLHTDAFTAYRGLESDYLHNVIDHAQKYVDGTSTPTGVRTSGAS
jgi:ISXO2-like transposase domain